MKRPPLTVYDWPNAASSLQWDQGLLVIAVRTPPTLPRAEARHRVRMAIKEVLATQLACPPDAIELVSQPGSALRLLRQEQNIGLSLSHEPGLSLAAIHIHGPVGVDLMALASIPPAHEIPTLATDYLGAKISEQIARLPPGQQGNAFAEAWTLLEARLKCWGEGLAEWCPTRENRLAACTSRILQMPDGYVGTVAFRN